MGTFPQLRDLGCHDISELVPDTVKFVIQKSKEGVGVVASFSETLFVFRYSQLHLQLHLDFLTCDNKLVNTVCCLLVTPDWNVHHL